MMKHSIRMSRDDGDRHEMLGKTRGEAGESLRGVSCVAQRGPISDYYRMGTEQKKRIRYELYTTTRV